MVAVGAYGNTYSVPLAALSIITDLIDNKRAYRELSDGCNF